MHIYDSVEVDRKEGPLREIYVGWADTEEEALALLRASYEGSGDEDRLVGVTTAYCDEVDSGLVYVPRLAGCND